MRRLLTMVTLVLALPAGAALADDDCHVPMADWQPREAVVALARDNGWTVGRIKIDDGCYELRGTDADGNSIKVKIDPGSLDLVEMRIRYLRKTDGRERGNGDD